MIKKLAAVLAFFSFFSTLHAADALDPLASQIERGLKNANANSVVVLEFKYAGKTPGIGGPVVQKGLADILTKRGFTVVPTSSSAQAFVRGEIRNVKSKVEIRAVLVETATGKIVGGGAQALAKTWKDPVTECGDMKFVPISTAAFAATGGAESVKIMFAQPWWPVQIIGNISWNFCRKDGKTPNLNHALPDLKKKAAELGGSMLQIQNNSLDDGNRKVLKIEATVSR
ncbi:MAG: hypothetical protein A2901_05430 [Elusimicrobia bacterium RIFCSPLOWO2_01_FULL_54_10]|nr:MAG: hypothetical protein A2901_05430 [Elusimicrobia bacterium RIFCSPLOWO2_01_FULL_54_10]